MTIFQVHPQTESKSCVLFLVCISIYNNGTRGLMVYGYLQLYYFAQGRVSKLNTSKPVPHLRTIVSFKDKRAPIFPFPDPKDFSSAQIVPHHRIFFFLKRYQKGTKWPYQDAFIARLLWVFNIVVFMSSYNCAFYQVLCRI